MKKTLIKTALHAMDNAYVPHSKFKVGAALLTKSGNIYGGCNIENASFPLTCCAERVAIFKAISAGEQQFKAMAVIADTGEVISPCGACRQVMAEFFTDDVNIYLCNVAGKTEQTTIQTLLPFSFQL